MATVILDCYTDEAAGLGVPPYLGTYPRYLAGHLEEKGEDYVYLTIDDLRVLSKYGGRIPVTKVSEKTNISVYNTTNKNTGEILRNAEKIIVVLGVHVPGKYLSALPGTLKEVTRLIKDIPCKKILTGPAVYGTRLEGGKFFEKADLSVFDKIENYRFSYDQIKDYAVSGAKLLKQIPDWRIIEIESGKGCTMAKCSFCTEPLKSRIEFRDKKDIIDEIGALYKLGSGYFRIGKQTCFYSYPKAGELLGDIRKKFPKIEVLHIDNVNPVMVLSKKGQQLTQDIVKYCTPGNVAAFGVESFDKDVYSENNLNCTAEQAYEAVKIINKYGASRGDNGMQNFLPGINLIFGLMGENKKTNEANLFWLKRFLKEKLLLRRINIRQVTVLEGTPLYKKAGNKFLKKNKKYYWKWRNQIRQEIDFPMLNLLVPQGTVIKKVWGEIYDGKTTFGRQIGTYPLIVGIKGRVDLKKFYNVKVEGHMLRSVVGEITYTHGQK